MNAPASKPVSSKLRPELTRLPKLTTARRLFRRFMGIVARLLVRVLLRLDIKGLENLPDQGAAIMVSNHLGDADAVLGIAFAPRPVEMLAKSELYDLPILGALMEAYGVIWVHRGRPDRRALRAALQGLAGGRLIAIAPEGRESLSGALEEGTNGAAYLALKSGAPLVPVALAGTANANLPDYLKRLRRAPVQAVIGKPILLENSGNRRADLDHGTEKIMRTLAEMLPPEYRGVYKNLSDHQDRD